MRRQDLWRDLIYRWIWGISVVVVVTFALVVFTNLFVQGIRTNGDEPKLGTVIGQLRGEATVVFRLPINPMDGNSGDQLIIDKEGRVARGIVPTRDVNAFTRMELVPKELATVDALRKTWCDTQPQFPDLSDAAQFYDLGLQCNPSITRRIKVPLGQLPDALQNVLDTVPPPQKQNK